MAISTVGDEEIGSIEFEFLDTGYVASVLVKRFNDEGKLLSIMCYYGNGCTMEEAAADCRKEFDARKSVEEAV